MDVILPQLYIKLSSTGNFTKVKMKNSVVSGNQHQWQMRDADNGIDIHPRSNTTNRTLKTHNNINKTKTYPQTPPVLISNPPSKSSPSSA